MSSVPNQQTHQLRRDKPNIQSGEEELGVSEGFKDEPPDQSRYFDGNEIAFDPFTNSSSLQATASAALAMQQQDLTSSTPQESMANLFASLSASRTADRSDQADLSRSSSVGRPSLSGGECTTGKEKGSHHSERHMWTQTETKALVDGCNKHGIGNWKAVLNDKELAMHFNGRTPGDLKDRFRTYFPDAYHELYPNAKTHTSRAVRSKAPDGKSIFEKGKTKERRPFTVAEDEVLRKGYEQFGSHWAVIAKNAVFEGRRKSTDLRDRFRNAFPSLYLQAGYKPRAKSQKKERRQSSGNGSFIQVDNTLGSQLDWQADALQRPALQSRSETSASAHSQAVSEHSELSEEEDSSDAIDAYTDRSDSIKGCFTGLPSPPNRPSASIPSMERSLSRSSSRSDQVVNSDGTRGPSTGSAHHVLPAKVPAVLRRTQSTKRANLKVGSLDQAVKAAYSKSNKEAVLASHHQAHLQHQQRLPTHWDAGVQRPPLNQSVSVGWPPRFTWAASASANLANMDLDQMDDIINSHSATELLSGSDRGTSMATQATEALGATADEAMHVDEVQTTASSKQPDFANLYQQLALAGANDDAANRALSVASFQDLLDPVLPLHNSGQVDAWDQSASNLPPWTPVSSANAALRDKSSCQSAANTATRREYEHNQWAGDLLHRGSYLNQDQTPQGFVSMASMHLSTSNPGVPASRSANGALGQASRTDSPLIRPQMAEQTDKTAERPALRPNEHGIYSTPSVHELLSRSARRQSYSPRPVGFGDDGDDNMQQYPYPYPADDISLLNSGAGGSLTLFPSLINSQVSEYNQTVMRRRRSTDTLRESAYSLTQSWRGGLMEGTRQMEEQEAEMAKDGSVYGRQRESASASSRHGTSEHSRSISDTQTTEDDDDDNAPSRAASVGNMHDNIVYAESLPDLTSGIDDHATGSGGDSAFSHNHNLQFSYDDMNIPAFLNRSHSFLHNLPITPSFGAAHPGAVEEDLQVGTSKLYSTSGRNEVAREVVADEQRRDDTKGPSKSVDWSSMSDLSSPFLFNPMKDAGALDRLEHLYLEGLHAPSSPLPTMQGMNDAAPNTKPPSATRRYPANNTWCDKNSAAGGGDGYESV